MRGWHWGGAGSKNSRRGTETCDGRVFGGDATARSVAMEAIARVKASLTNLELSIEVKTIPIGKPTNYSSGVFLQDWPALARPTTAMMTTDDENHPHSKRGSSCSWGSTISREDGDNSDRLSGEVFVDCPFEHSIAKRRRLSAETSSGMIQ